MAVKKKTTKAKKSVKRIVKKVKKTVAKKKMVKKVAKKVTKKLMKKTVAGMVGTVVHYYDRIGVAILELKAPVAVGDILLFKRGDFEFVQPVDSLQIDHQPVMKAGKGKVVGLKVSTAAQPGTLALKA
jgi:putative protease